MSSANDIQAVSAEDVILIEDDSSEEITDSSEIEQVDSSDDDVVFLKVQNKPRKRSQNLQLSLVEPSIKHEADVIDITKDKPIKEEKTVMHSKEDNHSIAKRHETMCTTESVSPARRQSFPNLEGILSRTSNENVSNETRHHRNSQKYTCDECGKKVGTIKVLKRHLKVIHILNTTETFTCERCSKVFHWRCHRDKHESKCVKRVYTCAMCDKKLLSKLGIKMHVANEHVDRDLVCTVCLQGFSAVKGLNIHMALKHKTGKKR